MTENEKIGPNCKKLKEIQKIKDIVLKKID